MGENERLPMYYPSTNSCIRNFNKSCCSWGQRARPNDINGELRGMASPLWANPAKKFFIVMCVITFISVVLFIIAYVVVSYKNGDILDKAEEEIANKDPDDACVIQSKKKLKVYFIIIGAALLFINALCYCYLGCKKYASDQEWSRYLLIASIICALLLIFNIIHYIVTIDNYKYFDKNEVFVESLGESKKTCKNLFRANLIINFIVCILSSIILILVIIRIMIIGCQFFIKSHVPHTAKCIDDDIIIID